MSLIEVASEEAQRRGVRVLAVHLRWGPLSGVVKEALLSVWELAREGSPLDDSRLEIEETPIRMRCPNCQAERPVASIQEMCCAECGEPAWEVTSGRELEITALEVAS